MSRGRPDPASAARPGHRPRAARGDRFHERSIPPWAEPARTLKMTFVAKTDRGDMAPSVVALRRGVVEAAVVAPRVDRDLALEAAYQLRHSLDADELVFSADCHAFAGKDDAEYERAREGWPGGLMQNACDELGACEAGRLMDCLNVTRIDRHGRLAVATIGYHYHGKAGRPFRWDDAPWWTDDHDAISGYIPECLGRIMREPFLLDEADSSEDEGAKWLREFLAVDPARCRAIMARTALGMLTESGYLVLDLFTSPGRRSAR